MIAKPAATEAQMKYLVGLITERALTEKQREAAEVEVKGVVTKERASLLVSYLKEMPYKPRVEVVAPTSVPSALPSLPASRYALATENLIGLTGIDADANGTIFFEVQAGQGKWKGRKFLKRLIGAPGDFLRYRLNANDEKIVAAAIAADALGAAQRFGREFSVCGKCGAALTDDESRAMALGPVCRKAF